ncbi:hypothetical protein NNJEOMEG_02944 [Fundidesulfovibrio magnetotacticus]|uniref:Nucleotidyltransferase substrate binding protein, HI0074 family n=1 Tax=Fundidesulfovibrio magnetotacticus TaxID=2730080 RepID=A0A6V8LW03_9BACT|nr:nucleotidyltransferase substrate binding protein [Fundidesulfovibrio magnetotacticus]GFK95090.1 hypothetical protein NNJEOMEG_02944 [Fundidesulfovibrio magnetotacticus]
MQEDIRWKQRFDNYLRALRTLRRGVELAETRDLTELEQQGLVQGFEFTHELAWNVLKDYLEDAGVSGVIGSKGATREAFSNGLIEDGEAWMDMIRARNLSSHTYNTETAEEIVADVLARFFPAFEQLARRFAALAEQSGTH